MLAQIPNNRHHTTIPPRKQSSARRTSPGSAGRALHGPEIFREYFAEYGQRSTGQIRRALRFDHLTPKESTGIGRGDADLPSLRTIFSRDPRDLKLLLMS